MDLQNLGFSQIQGSDLPENIIRGYLYENEELLVIEVNKSFTSELDEKSDSSMNSAILKKTAEKFGVRYLIAGWHEYEDVRAVIYSSSNEIRSLEMLDFLVNGNGLVKGSAEVATCRVSMSMLKVKMAEEDLTDPMEYLLKMCRSYFVDCAWVYAANHVDEHKIWYDSLEVYQKKHVPWAYINSTDVAFRGSRIRIKTLENESGLTIYAEENQLIMVGARGEVYDISKQKFNSSYTPSDEVLDAFESMMEYIPEVYVVDSGQYVSLDEMAHICYPKQGPKIKATKLATRTKVFQSKKGGEYFLGRPGEYLAVRMDDPTDIYIIRADIFQETYEPV